MLVVGRRRGPTHGTAGMTMILGIGIPGTGAIRSTIPHGMAGAILGITLLGIRLATMAIMGITILGMAVDISVEAQAATCRLTCVAISVAITTPMVRVVTAQAHVQAMLA